MNQAQDVEPRKPISSWSGQNWRQRWRERTMTNNNNMEKLDMDAWTDLVALLVHLTADAADRQAELERRLEAIEERFERAITGPRGNQQDGN
jgi:transcription elongation GreA/GreB family factor